MFKFLHSNIPNPIFLQVGPFTIHWYGLCIVTGFLLGLFIVLKLARKYQVEKSVIYDMCFYGLLFGIIGDRLYYVIYAWKFYKDNPLDIIKIWEGGLAIHGGIIAGTIVFLLFAKYSKSLDVWINIVKNSYLMKTFKKISWVNYFWFLLDFAIIILISGLMLGRWGNYFNQELFGIPTNLPWGIPIEQELIPDEFHAFSYFHPTFLYESLADALILLTLFILHLRRINKLSIHITDSIIKKKISLNSFGNIALLGLLLYSVVRFLNEFLRIDYSPEVFGVRWAQIISIFIVLLTGSLLFVKNLWKKKNV